MTDSPSTVEIETAPNPEFAVILMHGLGADANDFVPLVPELRLADAPAVRFVFPNAPEIAVTANNGYVMRAWYDILSFEGIVRRVDEAGIDASVKSVRALIAEQNRRGIASERIFLAGFSQGGAMTYQAGLTHPERLAGLIVLSGYIPSKGLIDASVSEANRHAPVFAAHGAFDDVLDVQLGQDACEFARELGCTVDWHTYPMAHTVCMEEVEALREWFGARLAAAKS
ncbi:alpha/beta hydrolase [Caballeronia grimmiae]|uniref:Carboxylesterase n=1 Tax=Caballeronia grimmiae TaxID=1071679 RepID=A0A069NNK0_9BURK|nr:alpha/beta hydrolase [Caballeronia grimmiae]KDR29787.1 carboxylesterase [Caballeronia grimmiae]GGD65880.1 carboxylesterase [Caballeronia grimmiae]